MAFRRERPILCVYIYIFIEGCVCVSLCVCGVRVSLKTVLSSNCCLRPGWVFPFISSPPGLLFLAACHSLAFCMSWQQCKTCGWWQHGRDPCGCIVLSTSFSFSRELGLPRTTAALSRNPLCGSPLLPLPDALPIPMRHLRSSLAQHLAQEPQGFFLTEPFF